MSNGYQASTLVIYFCREIASHDSGEVRGVVNKRPNANGEGRAVGSVNL